MQSSIVLHRLSSGGSWDKFYQNITLATKNLWIASAKMKVKKFVHISTEAVLFSHQPLLDVDETHPYPNEPNSYYGKAKKLAEIELLHSCSDLTTIIIRPPYIWGEGDHILDRLVSKIKAGLFMWVDGGDNIIETAHVENVVEAILRACVKGQDKGIYIVTDDDPISVKDCLTGMLKARGIEPTQRSLPKFVVHPVTQIVESVFKGFRITRPPPITRLELFFMTIPRRYNISRIKREFGYTPVFSRERGLKEIEEALKPA